MPASVLSVAAWQAQGSSGKQQGSKKPSGQSCSSQHKRKGVHQGGDPDTAHEGARRVRHRIEADKPADAGVALPEVPADPLGPLAPV